MINLLPDMIWCLYCKRFIKSMLNNIKRAFCLTTTIIFVIVLYWTNAFYTEFNSDIRKQLKPCNMHELPMNLNSSSTSVRHSLTDLKENFIETQSVNLSATMRTEERAVQIVMINAPSWVKLSDWNSFLSKCIYTNCMLSDDISIARQASAIMFHITRGNTGLRKPPIDSASRNKDQVWIANTLESPLHIDTKVFDSKSWTNAFNWTMTYRMDADILSPYGTLKSQTDLPSKNYSDIFDRKSKQGMWIVSNCHALSKRDSFVEELKKFGFHVDTFGSCGTGTIQNADTDRLFADYKFYLSLENSMCKDYITEKFFNRYNNDIILIVRGGANYNKIIPTGTYINSANYEKIPDLVHHLKSLGNDKDRYTSFLRAKDKYVAFGPHPFGRQYGLCELCEKLNNFKMYRKWYGKLSDHMTKGQCYIP